jgi:hypothetical protein
MPTEAAVWAALIAALASLTVAVITFFSQRAVAKRQAAAQHELESFKSELQGASDLLKDNLERARSFDVASRQQALNRIESLRLGLVQVSGYAEVIRKQAWIIQDGALATAEQGMTTALEGVKLDLAFLGAAGVFTPEHAGEGLAKQVDVVNAWGATLGELTRNEASFQQAHPEALKFSADRFVDFWETLKTAVNQLSDAIVTATTAAAIPR